MKRIVHTIPLIIAVGFLNSAMAAEQSPPVTNWPTARMPIAAAVSNSFQIVTATATKEAEVTERSGMYMNTSGTFGNGRTLHGGGEVVSAHCRQEFRLNEFLYGTGALTNSIVEYSFTEKSDVFPRPGGLSEPATAIPTNSSLILVFGENRKLLKVLPDTEANRNTIRDLLKSLNKTKTK